MLSGSPAAWRRPAVLVFIAAIVAALVAVHARRYAFFVPDDAWISLHYARRLIEGHGLTWTGGERVEGYSNLLFVLLCATGGFLGFELLAVARVIGVASVIAIALAVAYPWRPWQKGHARVAALFGMALVALAGPFAAWAMGGLEATLLAALLAWAVVLGLPAEGKPRTAAIGALLACAGLTRADGFVLVAAFALGFVLCSSPAPGRWRRVAALLLLPGLAYLSQGIFRWFYYGDIVPNTARVKVAISGYSLLFGLKYVAESAGALLPVCLAALAAAIVLHRSAKVRFVLLVSLSWIAYIVLVGGDWMPAHRQIVPILPLLVLAAAFLLDHLWKNNDLNLRIGLGLGAIVLLWFHWSLQAASPDNRIAREGSTWVWRCSEMAAALGTSIGKMDPLLAADAAGCWPYFSRFRTIDMLGLADRNIAQRGPSPAIRTVPGHAVGDGRYVLDRTPDLVAFLGIGSERPAHPSGLEMTVDPRFAERYRAVNVAAGQAQARLWVRKIGGPLGVRHDGDRIVIPALQFAGSGGVASAGRESGIVTIGRALTADGLALGPGAFRVDADCEGGTRPLLEIVAPDGIRHTGLPGFVVEFSTRTRVTVAAIAPGDAPVALQSVRIERVD